MINAPATDGTPRFCIQSIGRTVIKARKIASRNGTSNTLAACIPKIRMMTAAALIMALVFSLTIALICRMIA